jgi:broad specificity phosphatase PhoE
METHARIEPAVGEVITPPGVEDRAVWLKGVMAGRWTGLGPEFDEWRAGVVAGVDKLQDETAVFSHFVAINVIVGLLTDDDRVAIFRPAHCSITKLVRRAGKLTVVELGSEAATVVM